MIFNMQVIQAAAILSEVNKEAEELSKTNGAMRSFDVYHHLVTENGVNLADCILEAQGLMQDPSKHTNSNQKASDKKEIEPGAASSKVEDLSVEFGALDVSLRNSQDSSLGNDSSYAAAAIGSPCDAYNRGGHIKSKNNKVARGHANRNIVDRGRGGQTAPNRGGRSMPLAPRLRGNRGRIRVQGTFSGFDWRLYGAQSMECVDQPPSVMTQNHSFNPYGTYAGARGGRLTARPPLQYKHSLQEYQFPNNQDAFLASSSDDNSS